MGFKEVQSLDADVTITIGGKDKKTNKANPKGIEGYYLGKRQVAGGKFTKPGGFNTLYYFQTEAGNVAVWGKTDLNRKMSAATPGAMLRVTYAGMTPTPNGDMHKYKVEIDADNTIDVSGLADTDGSLPSGNTKTSSSYGEDDTEDTDEDNADDDVEAVGGYEATTTQAATAAERKSKVEALLNKNRAKN